MNFASIADTILVFAVILGGIGYAAGQFFSQRRRGQSDALSVALQEVEAVRNRASRLEKELFEVHGLITKLQLENETLRGVILDSEGVAKALKGALAENNDVLVRLLVKN